MTLSVHISAPSTLSHSISMRDDDPALQAIRFSFNPSGEPDVMILKALAAAFIRECQRIQQDRPSVGREMAVAITNMQTASMWGVLGVTTPRVQS